ncbi:neurogenic locus notch homolog protein 1-like [Saccostrea echinata]|uniref:neurogenic locus notch homolog protein 1-like n=1 Tax=Saccostrea echinata TaxID=191078 RepID=UPI002A8152EC|nr:neurogenic locus notch homolog protein 1-like [Saccostrea echinata]
MTKPCRICENGGTLSISSKSCQCDPYHKGICCNDVVTCQDQPCKHGRCTDQGASFMCTCDERYTGVTCDSRIMVLGCLCLKCCQALGVFRHNDVDDDKANRQKHKGDLIVLQNRPKPIGYNSHMETEF